MKEREVLSGMSRIHLQCPTHRPIPHQDLDYTFQHTSSIIQHVGIVLTLVWVFGNRITEDVGKLIFKASQRHDALLTCPCNPPYI